MGIAVARLQSNHSEGRIDPDNTSTDSNGSAVGALPHTVSSAMTQRRWQSIRWPDVKSLTLEAETGRAPTGILGQLLHTMDGPGKLLSMVTELVGSSAELQSARHP